MLQTKTNSEELLISQQTQKQALIRPSHHQVMLMLVLMHSTIGTSIAFGYNTHPSYFSPRLVNITKHLQNLFLRIECCYESTLTCHDVLYLFFVSFVFR